MPAPVLTSQEIAELKVEKETNTNSAALFTAQIAIQNAQAAKFGLVDSSYKKYFDYYNTNIIGQYDAERRAINGQYIASPITETDIQNPASTTASRTTPTLPATDVVRIAEFDGGPLIVDPLNEQQYIIGQTALENGLVFGYGSLTFSVTIRTSSAITPTSTTLSLLDPSSAITLAPGDTFVVSDGSNSAVVQVITITTSGTGPFSASLTILLVVPPSTTIPTNSMLYSFTGFSNGERASKTATNPALQPLMNSLISGLQIDINGRISNLNTELTALTSNQDPDGVSQINTATTAVNTSKTFLTSYLVSTDISNTGISSLASERTIRSTFLTTRLAQIAVNYTGQTKNYFDQRYTFANNRANTSRGSLRLQLSASSVAATSAVYAAQAQDSVNAIESILP